MNSGIVYFRKIILESSRSVSETTHRGKELIVSKDMFVHI